MIARAITVEAADVEVVLATLQDLLRRTGRRPTPRLHEAVEHLDTAVCDAQNPANVTLFADPGDPAVVRAYDLVSTAEAGRILGVTTHAVRALVRRGRLPAHSTGTRWLLPVRAVVERAEHQAARRDG